MPEWVGPRTWNREAAGSIPGSPKVVSGSLFVNFGMSWDVSGSGLGTFSDGFGMVLENMSDGDGNENFQK